MKKIKFILYLLCILCVLSLVSCKDVSEFNNQDYGKIKYYVAGLYIGVEKNEEFTMDDANPKVYFDFSKTGSKFGMLCTKSGTLSSAVTYSNLARNVKKEDGINKYYMSTKLTFVNSEVNKVNLYLIYIDKNGNFSVNEELTDKININDSSSYNFVTTFTNNKEKYQLQIKLMF